MVAAASAIIKLDHLQNQHLTATYNVRGIGRGGPMARPPRSPDLTPVNFFLLGHTETTIYTLPVDSEEDLIARIVQAASTTRQQPGNMFRPTFRSSLGPLLTYSMQQSPFEKLTGSQLVKKFPSF